MLTTNKNRKINIQRNLFFFGFSLVNGGKVGAKSYFELVKEVFGRRHDIEFNIVSRKETSPPNPFLPHSVVFVTPL